MNAVNDHDAAATLAAGPNAEPDEMLRLAFLIANRAVVADIESYGVKCAHGYYDVRPMLDPREHAPEAIDMAREALAYALASHIAVRHPQLEHLVRIVPRAAPREEN